MQSCHEQIDFSVHSNTHKDCLTVTVTGLCEAVINASVFRKMLVAVPQSHNVILAFSVSDTRELFLVSKFLLFR